MGKKSSKTQRRQAKPSSKSRRKPELLKVAVSQLPKESDPSIRLIWVDTMEIAVRGDVPISTLRFYSAITNEKLCEAFRLQTSVPHLRSMVDVICRSIGYYPSKPDM